MTSTTPTTTTTMRRANDADQSESSPLADAMLAVVSRCAEDVASHYGLKMSQVMGLLGQMK